MNDNDAIERLKWHSHSQAEISGGWTFLTTPLTSTSWDGDARSDESPTLIDLSSVFSAPAGIKAILARLACRDSATLGTTGMYSNIGPDETYNYQMSCVPVGGDVINSITGICTCNIDGDIYYRINASGSNTMDVWLEIWGYYV